MVTPIWEGSVLRVRVESNSLEIVFLKTGETQGTWVSQWVKASAIGSDQDPRVLGLSPA